MKIFKKYILLFSLFFITGCTVNNINKNNSIEIKEITKILLNGKEYTILSNIVEEKDLGNLIAPIQKYVVLDTNKKIIDIIDFNNLDKIKEKAYLIQFSNIYSIKNFEYDTIAVNINNKFYKAVYSENISNLDEVITLDNFNNIKTISINIEDCTQIIYGDKIYQITNEIISNKNLDEYLGILGKNILYDKNTKKPILKENLKHLDILGSDKQQRVNWIYGDVYSIKGVSIENSVAVKINNKYYLANVVMGGD